MNLAEPLIDIVMLVHDQARWAKLAIEAVESFTANPFRLIVVDSASVESETKMLLRDCEERGHTVIHLAKNKSFSNGVNVGVNAGAAKFICVLNDDAIVTEGWDTALIQDASPKYVGLAGARSNFALGPQGDPGYLGKPPFLVFVCVMLRREIWNKIGPMDEETFDSFSSEDLDYSWRVLKAGFELKVSNAFVLHAGSRTIAAKAPSNDWAHKNNLKYAYRLIEKWGKDWYAEHTRLKTRVLVASFHAEEMTRVDFAAAVNTLRGGTGFEFSYLPQKRLPIHIARQLVCDYALDSGYDVLVQLDDDALFPPDLIRRLLAHEKEVVVALAYQRRVPHLSCIYELCEDKITGKPLEGIEHTGLRRVDVSGFHCSMLRTSVIKKMRDFRDDKHKDGIRQYFGGFENKVGEDFAFSHNLRKIGVQIFCDTELISGHIGASIVVNEEYKKSYQAGVFPKGNGQ